jgi:hypothetical protein
MAVRGPQDLGEDGQFLVGKRRQGRENVWQLEQTRLAEARGYLDTISKRWDSALARLKALVEE